MSQEFPSDSLYTFLRALGKYEVESMLVLAWILLTAEGGVTVHTTTLINLNYSTIEHPTVPQWPRDTVISIGPSYEMQRKQEIRIAGGKKYVLDGNNRR